MQTTSNGDNGSNAAQLFLDAARSIVQSSRTLIEVFRKHGAQEIGSHVSKSDIHLLVEVMKLRVFAPTVFDILSTASYDDAISFLYERYLRDSDPDSGYGGYTFDVSSFFSDIVEKKGLEGLEAVLGDSRCGHRVFSDPRVSTAIFDAVEGAGVEVGEWIASVKRKRIEA